MSDEAVIDGVLSFRDEPGKEWRPYHPKAMTVALVSVRKQLEEYKAKCSELERTHQRIRALL